MLDFTILSQTYRIVFELFHMQTALKLSRLPKLSLGGYTYKYGKSSS